MEHQYIPEILDFIQGRLWLRGLPQILNENIGRCL